MAAAIASPNPEFPAVGLAGPGSLNPAQASLSWSWGLQSVAGLAARDGRLGDLAVEPTSLRQFQRIVRDCDALQRFGWETLLRLIVDGSLMPFPTNRPGQDLRFGRQVLMADGRQLIVGVNASQDPDERMRLRHVSLIDPPTRVAYSVPDEAPAVRRRLDQLRELAGQCGDGTGQAYADTAWLLDGWMRNSRRGTVLDVRGDVGELLLAFIEHVGGQSYPGRNAGVVMQALAGGRVLTAAQPRVFDVRGSSPVSDPLALDPWVHQTVVATLCGRRAIVMLENHWHDLLVYFSREQISRVLSSHRPDEALSKLLEVGPELMKSRAEGGLGFTAEQLVHVVESLGSTKALDALLACGPALIKPLAEGGLGLTTEQMVRAVSHSGGGLAFQALHRTGPALMKPPSQGGLDMTPERLVIAAVCDGGADVLDMLLKFGPLLTRPRSAGGLGLTTMRLTPRAARLGVAETIRVLYAVGKDLLDAGISTDDLGRILNKRSSGPVLHAVAQRLPDVEAGRIDLKTLVDLAVKSRTTPRAVLDLGLGLAPDDLGRQQVQGA